MSNGRMTTRTYAIRQIQVTPDSRAASFSQLISISGTTRHRLVTNPIWTTRQRLVTSYGQMIGCPRTASRRPSTRWNPMISWSPMTSRNRATAAATNRGRAKPARWRPTVFPLHRR